MYRWHNLNLMIYFAQKKKTKVMEINELVTKTDLQIFIEKFEPSKFKMMAKGIEIRGIINMHWSIVRAKDLIERLELKLIVSHNAEMLTYGGFEVNIP